MKSIVVLLTVFLGILQVQAQKLPYPKEHYNLEKNVAIQGFDPVSYFSADGPKEGNKSISYNHSGVTYNFISESNKKLFIANPEKYEPQYGGYCAYAMADGEKVRVDPETYKIIDGKLYLFYNFRFTNTLKLWNKKQEELLSKAEMEWSKIIKN